MARKTKRWTSLPSKAKTTNGEKVAVPLESDLQKQLIEWAGFVKYKNNYLDSYIHHSPNGGYRELFEAIKFRLMGVRAGYPDLIIDIAKGGYHGMRLELKRSPKEKVSNNQALALQLLSEEGYYVTTACSLDEATLKIERYIDSKEIRQ